MNVIYLEHSGFYLKTEHADFLFDYYKGKIPASNKEKPLFVFVSHGHQDHYNPAIFELIHKHACVKYILPKGTQIKKYVIQYEKHGIDLSANLMLVKKKETYEITLDNGMSLKITTLKSTDIGVAYLLDFESKTIYHAGDLNLWIWEEESTQFNDNMIRKYFVELEKLKGRKIDVAFVPLDVRQGKYAFEGMKSFLEYTDTKYVFPMHMWGQYDIVQQFLTKYPEYLSCINKIEHANQCFILS